MRRPQMMLLLLAAATSATLATPSTAAKKVVKSTAKRVVVTSTRTTVAPATPSTTTPVTPLTGSITVFAAASLTAAFNDIAAAFEEANPEAKVTVIFAGSSSLVNQIQNGAPADVFASADLNNMERLAKASVIERSAKIFTRNRLMIVVPRGNRLRVQTLADLAKPEVSVALGAPGVPAGDYAREILAKAGVEVKPKTLEPSVSGIVTKAALGEIDAGIVYVTDVAIDEYRVDGVAIPDAQNIVASYPIVALKSSKNSTTAKGFVAFVQSPTAQSILAKYKFLPLK